MRDLPTMAADLLAGPICTTPSLEQLAARARLIRLRRRGLAAAAVLAGLFVGQEFVVQVVKSHLL